MKFFNEKIVTFLTVIFLSASCAHKEIHSEMKSVSVPRTPSSQNDVYFHGLKEIDIEHIKNWTQGLYSTTGKSGALPKNLSVVKSIDEAFKKNNNINDLMNDILSLKLHQSYSKKESYHQLVEGLFAARKKVRNSLSSNEKYTKEAMLLLELLAEETLYVNTMKFKLKSLIRFDYTNALGCGQKHALLNKTQICQGDILASKGGAGSSSFLARTADYPGNFSHAATPYIDEEGHLFMVEAFIEDGVKLRDPTADYVNDPKSKLVIYRAKDPKAQVAGVLGVENFVTEMKNKLDGLDPQKNAAFEYDFKMDASNDEKHFCSELVYHAYGTQDYIKANPELNPYANVYWSKVENVSRAKFLTDFLGAKTTFPAPSDIELNPNFEIVSVQINPEKLKSDRIRVALIDVIIQEMEENQDELIRSIEKLGTLGTEEVDAKNIRARLKLFEAFGIKVPDSSLATIDSIPKNINYKQLLFFALIDSKLSPEAVTSFSELENEMLKKGEILDIKTIRSQIRTQVRVELKNFSKTIDKVMESSLGSTMNPNLIEKVCDISKFF
jgi:hypothetical protein